MNHIRTLGALPPSRPESEWTPKHRDNIERIRALVAAAKRAAQPKNLRQQQR